MPLKLYCILSYRGPWTCREPITVISSLLCSLNNIFENHTLALHSFQSSSPQTCHTKTVLFRMPSFSSTPFFPLRRLSQSAFESTDPAPLRGGLTWRMSCCSWPSCVAPQCPSCSASQPGLALAHIWTHSRTRPPKHSSE